MLHFCHYFCAAPARTPAGHGHAVLHFLRSPAAPALTANGFTATDRFRIKLNIDMSLYLKTHTA